MKRQYFVKFVRYNNHTLSNLINKTIKFSTVYEFNDFNELHYLSPLPDCMPDKLKTLTIEKVSDKRLIFIINPFFFQSLCHFYRLNKMQLNRRRLINS